MRLLLYCVERILLQERLSILITNLKAESESIGRHVTGRRHHTNSLLPFDILSNAVNSTQPSMSCDDLYTPSRSALHRIHL